MAKAKATRHHEPGNRVLPNGYSALAHAVVTQGLLDAVEGEKGAREWLWSRGFEYWCDWCELNPEYWRRMTGEAIRERQRQPQVKREQVGGREGTGRQFTAEELARAVALHDGGRRWQDVARIFRTNEVALRMAVREAGYETGLRSDKLYRVKRAE